MSVVACPFPEASALRGKAAHADYRDSYRVPLSDPSLSVVEAFHAVFGHRPGWMKFALVVRNQMAALCGLKVPPSSRILKPEIRKSYAVGEVIGSWPIFAINESELVAGRDNDHLDFRLSVLKNEAQPPSITISTTCSVHNRFGRLYLSFVLPFHRKGLPWLIASAASSGRL